MKHEQNGLVVPVRDAHALTEALGRLSGDEGLRRRLGTKARQIAEGLFDEQRVFAEILATYGTQLQAAGLSPPGRSAVTEAHPSPATEDSTTETPGT